MVVFYVAIVLLLIGTNLRANRVNSGGGGGRGTREPAGKKHVVELSETGKTESRFVKGNKHEQIA